jgi:hypothetical protein
MSTKQTGESNGLPGEQSGLTQGKTTEGVALELRVEAASKRETGQLIGELQAFLQQSTEGVQFERRREDPASQDAGTLLVAVLSPALVELAKVAGPALKELAKGLADWIRKRRVSVVVDGVSLEGPPEQVESVLRKLLERS